MSKSSMSLRLQLVQIGIIVVIYSLSAAQICTAFPLKQLAVIQDSTTCVANAHIMNVSKRCGAVSDLEGHASLIATLSDTIQISSVGFKNLVFIVDSIFCDLDTVVVLLERDTVELQEIIVNRQWQLNEKMKRPSWEQQSKETTYALKNVYRAGESARMQIMSAPPPITEYARGDPGKPPGINVNPQAFMYYWKKMME